MPLNCWPPVPVPAPAPVLAPSELPVPVPREGAAVRTGRGAPPLSSYTGRARVLFWSVGGLTSTGGSSVDATFCAFANVALKAKIVVASRSARRRCAVGMLEDMVQPRYDVSGTSQRTKSHLRLLKLRRSQCLYSPTDIFACDHG